MSDHSELISQFCSLTQADPEQAQHILEASKWDLNMAVNQFFGGDNPQSDNESDDHEMEEASPSPPPVSSSGARASGGNQSRSRGLVSFSDLRREGSRSADPESDEEETQQDFFAGGEKSGLAIKTPGKGDGGKEIIHNILNKAKGEAQRRQAESTPGPSKPRFSGVGQTLGSEDTPSVTVSDPSARQPRAPEIVSRSLTFWRNGFSIEDGPLMRYDDPNNQEILRAIQSGRAPTHLMGVQQGQQADVHVFKRLEEDYVAPKKKQEPFSGQGVRLGSPTPDVVSTVSAPTPAAAPSSQTTSAPQVEIDSTQPTTTLQIRLGDGTRLVSRFNHTHTVGDLYGFVNSASVSSRNRNYVLQTTFPNKELTDHAQTIKDAGLINAVVVQKWR
ncbi:hypothetical protein BDZ91DRAFT_689772 [Kalaharituber pfeilii]|nr:hypothetical protein BDZ91DRAFT_689772 [Kalaharituber pfeilii]